MLKKHGFNVGDDFINRKVFFLLILLIFSVVCSSGCVNQNSSSNSYVSYSQDDVDYFSSIAFGTEDNPSDTRLSKWTGDIKVKIIGSPTDEDMKMINYTFSELNKNLNGITISLDDSNPNMKIYFVPQSDFSNYIPSYVSGNEGYFNIWWNSDKAIYKSTIVISTDTTQNARSHLIIHEITQSLGLGMDSNKYSDSIFNELPSETTQYSQRDITIIKMLYQNNLKPGMSKQKVLQILEESATV